MWNNVGASVPVSAELILIMNIKDFLQIRPKKQNLINLLAEYMASVDITDSDYKICTVTIYRDISQLLIHHADLSHYYEKMYMITSRQTLCIFTLKRNLDPELIYGLLSLHASSGCDTTSGPYGI